MKKVFILISIFFIILLVVYLVVEFAVNQPDMEVMAYTETVNTGDGIKQLVADVEAGNRGTGISSWDDNIVLGDTLEFTPESGDFLNIKKKDKTSNVSFTWIQDVNWIPNLPPAKLLASSQEFYDRCTFYPKSGVVLLDNKYILSAFGSYYSYKFGFDPMQGQLYRVNLNDGTSYDIVTVDQKDPGDDLAIRTPDGKYSLGHRNKHGGDRVSITEFYQIRASKSYPTYTYNGVSLDLSRMQTGSDPYLDTFGLDRNGGQLGLTPFNNADSVVSITHIEDIEVQSFLNGLLGV